MAERVNEQCYQDMISALRTFAKEILEESKGMLLGAKTCQSALGENDEGAGQLVSKMEKSAQNFSEAASLAIDIARKMQDELDKQKQERSVWSSDD